MVESPSSSHPPTEEKMHEGQPSNKSQTSTEPGEDVPDPPFCDVYGRMDLKEGGLNTQARITEDGRVAIRIQEETSRLLSLFKPPKQGKPFSKQPPSSFPYVPPPLRTTEGREGRPRLNIVIHVVGSRGDVQPFVALGQTLKRAHGHRVRLATHPTFKTFVEENGLEFFSIGGDPAELMAFMVKNPGLMPGMDALKNGDIRRRRAEISTIISGCWRSCFEAGDGTGARISDKTVESVCFDEAAPPFVADVIIANPPSFAHVHCAEKLGIPLHLMFTMPWSPTQSFPHPLASIQGSNADVGVTNYVSYAVVEMMTWQGLGDIINHFRERSLGLEPISLLWAPAMIPRMRIPWTYCWSPALIPKPNDWGNIIDVSGFFFLSLASDYTPPEDLANFLAAGPPPIYIGFGSIVVDDPNKMTQMIFEAVQKTGQRALVSKGWGGLGADELDVPEGVFMLGNCPHDWLFQHVSCVVHHGGAGTTAAGIALGRPTVVIPFFGDQPFWGAMIARAGAGPEPIPYKKLDADKLAAAISTALQPTSLEKARDLGEKIRHESGVTSGVDSFYRHLDIEKMRCRLAPDRVAVFRVKRTNIRLSGLAAAVLNAEGLLDLNDVKLYRPKEHFTEPEPLEPITGGGVAMIGGLGELVMGFADLPIEAKKGVERKMSRPSSRKATESQPETPISDKFLADESSLRDASSGTPGKSPIVASPIQDKETPSTTEKHDGSQSYFPTTDEGSSTGKSSVFNGSEETSAPSKDERLERQGSKMDLESILTTTKTAAKIFNSGLKAPTHFTLAVAKGFHNAPLLYGDDTVREPSKVTGIKSGLKAAGREFGFGFADGIAGLAIQPLEGAKKGGAAGAIKGIAKGISGLVLKPSAGIWGLTGYTMSGFYKEIQKRFGESVENYILASRYAQGMADYSRSTTEEKEEIIRQWTILQSELNDKKKKKSEQPKFEPSQQRDPEKPGSQNLDKDQIELQKTAERANRRQAFKELFRGLDSSTRDAVKKERASSSNAMPEDYEEAIKSSVHATSKGNPEEDEMIERALRASMVELRAAQAAGEEEERAYQLAIDASLREAEAYVRERRATQARQGDSSSAGTGALPHPKPSRPPELPPRQSDPMHGRDDEDDEHLQAVLEESRRLYEEEEERTRHDETSLETVLEYVKRQSLAELEFERRRSQRDEESELPPPYSEVSPDVKKP